jgi:muramoyltetrapeptide carboxypeptidase LdcA involved in peptidoglycan recycling
MSTDRSYRTRTSRDILAQKDLIRALAILQVVFIEHALNHCGIVSDSAEHRVQDIHDMFLDPKVKAIIAAIGGDHSCHLLPLLEFDLIRVHPTVFMGYSDISVLNIAIWQSAGLITFNGPAILTDFAEHPRMFHYTEQYFLQAVTQESPIGLIEPSSWWTEEFQDWERQADRERPLRRHPSSGWTWLREGSAEGVMIGGCIESLEHLRGTRFWPQWMDFGHTAPQFTLPLGCRGRIDSQQRQFEIMEPTVA